MASAMRFTTTELAELETKIANAADRALAIELRFRRAGGRGGHAEAERLPRAPPRLPPIDVAAALADLAEAERWTRARGRRQPAFCRRRRPPPGGRGRHSGAQAADAFVANDCDLSPEPAADRRTARSGC
jgi:DNA mismatch repair protein MutS